MPADATGFNAKQTEGPYISDLTLKINNNIDQDTPALRSWGRAGSSSTGYHIFAELFGLGHFLGKSQNRLPVVDPFHKKLSAILNVHGIEDIPGG